MSATKKAKLKYGDVCQPNEVITDGMRKLWTNKKEREKIDAIKERNK